MHDSQQILSTCPYCGVGCGVMIRKDENRYDIQGDVSHPANRGRICPKGSMLIDTLNLDGRLLHPQINNEQVSWDRALDKVANGFRQTLDNHGPDSVAFYVSGQLLTEDYYVANKLMKGFIGGANIDTNSRLCMASSVVGHKRAFGKDTVPGCYDDLELAELVVLVGSNLAWCHPVLYQRLLSSKNNNPNKKIIVIDPRRTETAEIADLFLPIKPGTDTILFNGLLSFLQQNNGIDRTFTDTHTENFAAAMEAASMSAVDIESVANLCDLEADQVRYFYSHFLKTGRAVTVYSQGVNQSTSGSDKVNSIINVHLATGKIGKRGCGPFSITGQPNAMGGREVGGLANQLAAHMDFAEDDIDRVRRFWDSPAIATRAGLTAVDMFEQLAKGKIKAIWIMATNPAVSMPDANRVRSALERCELVVVSDCVESTDTNHYANILLPALAWGEKEGTVTNSERCISRQRTFMPAPGEAKADWWIIAEVAKRLGFQENFTYNKSADIFREHARLSGFENAGTRDFDISGLAELSDQEYEQLPPTYWPKPSATKEGIRRLFADGQFFTPSGKAQFVAVYPEPPAEKISKNFPLILNTGRVRDQWHTMTRTGKSARLATHVSEPVADINPSDVETFSLSDGCLAKIENARGSMVVRVSSNDSVAIGQVFVPMHWSRQFASDGGVGGLVSPQVDPYSKQPELKFTPVSIRQIDYSWYGFMLIREPATAITTDYWTRSAGDGFWCYELAGHEQPESWDKWAREIVGDTGSWVEFRDDSRGLYRCAVLVGERLQACIFIAKTPELPSKTWLSGLFNKDSISDAARLNLLSGLPGPGEQEAGKVVCACFSIGRNVLLEAIHSQQLTTTSLIGKSLKAGTNCGFCIPELNKIIKESDARLKLSAGV